MNRVDRSWGKVCALVRRRAMTWAAMMAALVSAVALPAHAAEPLIVISPTASGTTNLCDTDCSICTVASGECIVVGEEDLALCRPTSTGLPITKCDWSLFLKGTAANLQINQQIRALDIAPNGNLTLVVLNDTVVPGVGNLRKQDIAVLNPVDPPRPYLGGAAYDDGTFKLYLDGNLSQQDAAAKPWDALDLLADGTCETHIDANGTANYDCPIVGSLTSGATSGTGLDGVHFENEDLLRCIPEAFSGGTIEDCKFSMFLEADRINGAGNGINGDIEAVDFLNFDSSTMSGQMVFKMSGGLPPGFPAHDNGKDLLLYDGTFGAGLCVPSGKFCAGIEDCLVTDTDCNTGSCVIGGAPCASDDDCADGTCNVARTPTATVTKWFDGVAVGLSGTGQNIEAFAIVPESDGDGVPDGLDNCPSVANPPSVCSGPGPETCPSGLSTECPSGELCVQVDTDQDGVGDPCDQCNGRPDAGTCDSCPGANCPVACAAGTIAECDCGDGIFDFPSEQCDLGASNGQPGSPCSATCTIMGKCTRAPFGSCTQGSDCPQFASGEGCCGNDVRDDVDGPGGVTPDEDCDDGNTVDDDLCSNVCKQVPGGIAILGCEDLTGPNILPAFIKVTKFKDTPEAADIDRWKTKGEAIFATGITIDPDSENTRIIYNNTPSGELFSSTLGPGNFVQNDPTKLKWKFKDKEADVIGSPSWRKGKFTIKSTKIKFTLDGRKEPLFTLAEAGMPPTMRQTVRVGDVCITAVFGCAEKGKTLKCPLP